jgi:hypothetical protein
MKAARCVILFGRLPFYARGELHRPYSGYVIGVNHEGLAAGTKEYQTLLLKDGSSRSLERVI